MICIRACSNLGHRCGRGRFDAGQGATTDLYLMYMREKQRRPASNRPGPRGLRSKGFHTALLGAYVE